jgi:hypothetical protein
MRTARENGQTFSFHVDNQEALVHDQRIWLPLSRARALEMVAQATLEALSRNLAAKKNAPSSMLSGWLDSLRT